MIQLIFHLDADQAPRFGELLEEAGALAVTLHDSADEPLYEPPLGTTPLWSRTSVVGLFETQAQLDAALSGLQAFFSPLPQYEILALPDKDWERECLDSFQPICFGTRLWVCPSWHDPPDPNAVNLLLDPGLAFGTGTHPTTALCLEWLAEQHLEGSQVIDYGCGSGILAVAAAKLGARHVWAVDNDPQALQATHANALKNGVAERLHISLPDPVRPVQADLLLANILARPLIELARYFAECVRPQGKLVLSGILATQAEEVSAAYQTWFSMAPVVQRGEWTRLEGRRKSAKVV